MVDPILCENTRTTSKSTIFSLLSSHYITFQCPEISLIPTARSNRCHKPRYSGRHPNTNAAAHFRKKVNLATEACNENVNTSATLQRNATDIFSMVNSHDCIVAACDKTLILY